MSIHYFLNISRGVLRNFEWGEWGLKCFLLLSVHIKEKPD